MGIGIKIGKPYPRAVEKNSGSAELVVIEVNR